MNAELLMLIAGVSGFVLTVYWVHSRELSERYAMAWMLVATLLLVCGLFPLAIEDLAKAVRLSYPAAVLFVALGIIYLFAFSVSVALTKLQRRNLRLMQQIALLENRLRDLERSQFNPYLELQPTAAESEE